MPERSLDLLCVDGDEGVLCQVERLAQENGWSIALARNGRNALEILERSPVKVVLTELNLPDLSGLQILEWLLNQTHSPKVILTASHATVETAVKAFRMKAYDYWSKPLDSDQAIASGLRRALDAYGLGMKLSQPPQGELFPGLIGRSPKLKAVLDMVANVAQSDSTVLVLGESGTGKELVAKAVHSISRRRDKPFVVINCAAMPETLLESELFGYLRGAFTGAAEDKAGLFETATGGVVFLDEIGEIGPATQVKLLRVLQEGEIRRLGENKERHVDVRVVAATNRDLKKLVEEGKFREDLYYRLNVISIVLPPLRDRGEDILLLANHFLKEMAASLSKEVTHFSVDALQALQEYSWPGNVRELENAIERAVVLCDGDTITAKNLNPRILSKSFYTLPSQEGDWGHLNYKEAKKKALTLFNQSYMTALLDKCGGNITTAALRAGMDRSNFKKIIKKYAEPKKSG